MKIASQVYLLSAVVLALVSTTVAGQDNDSDLTDRLLECKAIESALERLDCYDQVTRSLPTAQSAERANQASAARDGVAEGRGRAELNREQASERRDTAHEQAQTARQRAQQGEVLQGDASDNSAQSDDFGREHRRAESGDATRSIEIREAWQNPHGLWRFRLADGSEWHQTQSGHFDYREGEQYQIERGLLNSFRLSREGSNRNIRVRRVD